MTRQGCIGVAILLGFCVCCGQAYSDGIYVPPLGVEELPKIPRQQALIVWTTGNEQLVIASDLEGSGKKLGWIVPVPAEPTALEPVSPGIFYTLNAGLQPKLINGVTGTFCLGVLLVAWALFLWAFGRFVPGRALMAALVLCFLLFPQGRRQAYRGDPETPRADVQILRAETVGNYDVEVLRAKDAGVLRTWLAENGFQSLPAKGDEIVQEYISEGWVFVAAKLQRAEEGYARPHPLSITFPTPKPIYPMRLTQLAHSDLLLDLFVAAPERADAPGMETRFCDRYRVTPYKNEKDFLQSETMRPALGLPWLVQRMSSSPVLTHLRTKLKNQDMNQDIWLTFKPFSPEYSALYLPQGHLYASIGHGLFVFGIILLAGFLYYYARRPEKRGSWTRAKVIFVACILAVPMGIHAWFTLPRGTALPPQSEQHEYRVLEVALTLRDHPDILRTMSKNEISAYFDEALADAVLPLTGEPVRPGEGPGQYEILEDTRGIVVRWYSEGVFHGPYGGPIGIPVEQLLLNAAGEPAKSFFEGL